FQAEDGIRDFHVTGVQTCALPILRRVAGGQRPLDHGNVVAADGRKRCGRLGGERGVAFERDDEAGDPGKNGARIAAAAADIEHRSEERRVGKGGRSRWWTYS